jgi:hypothetical protein
MKDSNRKVDTSTIGRSPLVVWATGPGSFAMELGGCEGPRGYPRELAQYSK